MHTFLIVPVGIKLLIFLYFGDVIIYVYYNYEKSISYLETIHMKTLRPINIKQGKSTNPNNSFFSEKKKELLGWDSNPRHTAC